MFIKVLELSPCRHSPRAPVWAAFTALQRFCCIHWPMAQINFASKMSLNLPTGRMRLNKIIQNIFGEIRAGERNWAEQRAGDNCGAWPVEGAVSCQRWADEAQLQLIPHQGHW